MKDIREILEMFDNIKAPYFCSYQKLKECFRNEIKKHHPDKMGNEDRAKEIITSFRELENIYKNAESFEFYKTLYLSTIEKSDIGTNTDFKSKETRRSKFVIDRKLVVFAIILAVTILIFGDILMSLLITLGALIVLWGYTKV
ncbi:MAG: hypothetical protein ACK4F9_04050 [Brevinematia bacterium]